MNYRTPRLGVTFAACLLTAGECGAVSLIAAMNPRSVGSQNTAMVINGAVPIDSKNPEYVLQLGRGRVYLPNIFATVH